MAAHSNSNTMIPRAIAMILPKLFFVCGDGVFVIIGTGGKVVRIAEEDIAILEDFILLEGAIFAELVVGTNILLLIFVEVVNFVVDVCTEVVLVTGCTTIDLVCVGDILTMLGVGDIFVLDATLVVIIDVSLKLEEI